MTRSFAVGVVHYKMREDIFLETIAGIRESSLTPSKVVVVNNGGVLPSVREAYVDYPDVNLGCAGGWNRAMQICDSAEVVILINDDCRVATDTFERMLADPCPIVLASGFACFKLEAKLWKQIGPFDERFWPAYYEDMDYKIRLKRLGIIPPEWPVDETETGILGRTKKPSGIVHGFFAGPNTYRQWKDVRFRAFNECLEANKRRYVEKWNDGTYELPFNGQPDPGVGGRATRNAHLLV